jgi:CheY-like chemotaxis protein
MLANTSVLLIEDDENQIFLLRYLLEKEGYTVVCLSDAAHALSYISSNPPVQIVITDFRLSGNLRGNAVIKAVREDFSWKNVPILVLSANSDPATIDECIMAGASKFLSKPYHPSVLIEIITELIGKEPN